MINIKFRLRFVFYVHHTPNNRYHRIVQQLHRDSSDFIRTLENFETEKLLVESKAGIRLMFTAAASLYWIVRKNTIQQ